MDNPWAFVLDNSSEAIENVSATLNATATPVKTTSKQTVSTLVVATVGLVVGYSRSGDRLQSVWLSAVWAAVPIQSFLQSCFVHVVSLAAAFIP